MHVAFAKIKAPLKAKVRLLKAELAVLATADQPDNKAISSKIDELLAVKKQLMQKRYAHIAEMRKVLTTGQRASFDMQVLKKVKGKRRYHH
jgi:Spy/CpxP family protein refolding chaperone